MTLIDDLKQRSLKLVNSNIYNRISENLSDNWQNSLLN